ncbi:hypothetical protein D1007_33415 [Hordeum vulgare]|nr:hypothetical protein D1007_33415 [Hordeum vulgare]
MPHTSFDGAAANSFDRRLLHEWEAYALHEANYPTPPDMHVLDVWTLSIGVVPVPPPSSASEHRGESRASECLCQRKFAIRISMAPTTRHSGWLTSCVAMRSSWPPPTSS